MHRASSHNHRQTEQIPWLPRIRAGRKSCRIDKRDIEFRQDLSTYFFHPPFCQGNPDLEPVFLSTVLNVSKATWCVSVSFDGKRSSRETPVCRRGLDRTTSFLIRRWDWTGRYDGKGLRRRMTVKSNDWSKSLDIQARPRSQVLQCSSE